MTDPLAGPEEAAALAGGEQPQAPPPALEPFKIVGQLIGARRNAEGEIVGEEVMGEVAIYRPNFDKVATIIDDAVEAARRATE